MAGEEQESKNKGFRLLGILDVQKTPCAREAILHGAGGSLAAGLLHFLTTSRVKRSFDIGFAGFMLTTLGSWFYCRMNNAKIRVQQRIIQDGIKNKVVYEGSGLDPTNKPGAETTSGPS
ncbi:cytochrome c oxidase protein 20 homolog [Seriola lalandi dorsalis]|uniref:Cytochrome c oxidase assembly protein COX20, mitochondrial n=1 Tax=Seriola lalandi dorsalis TaxID=1841481 RepID=A0A3B4XFK8_SERLL|nr:cytochrome c oxidase protein 20 homolog [Seriola lalandi dorsalis]XP_056251142.1 cytochrome c oxidase assembly protein COX20, mitochondrial [Seriola aureovittata]